MSTPTPVSGLASFTIPDDSVPTVPAIQLYRLDNEVPERIEAVHMRLTYESDPAEITNDVFVVQLLDLSGKVLDEIPSGTITGQVHIPMVVNLNWNRLGNDIPALGVYPYQTVGLPSLWLWTNSRLPEFVLTPGSTVNLLCYRDRDTESPAIQVDDATVVTTPFPGAASTVAPAEGIPLLTPTDNS